MCEGCWNEHDRIVIDTPPVRAAAAAIQAVYNWHSLGGVFHVVLDDWNIESDDVAWCASQIGTAGYPREGDEGQALLDAERACYEAIKGLSEDELASAIALQRGYWHPAETTSGR